jgi:Flp pilus assembly pilin Flp
MGNTSNQRSEGRRLGADTRGITTVEYAIVGALVAIVSIGAWQSLGNAVAAKADGAAAALSGGMPGAAAGVGGGGVRASENPFGGSNGGWTSTSANRPAPGRDRALDMTNRGPLGFQ